MLNYFLLRFDPKTCSRDVQEFSETDEAFAALHKAEREFGSTHEVVLFMADSLDTIRLSHSSYFACDRDNDAVHAPISPLNGASGESLGSALADIQAEHQEIKRLLAQLS